MASSDEEQIRKLREELKKAEEERKRADEDLEAAKKRHAELKQKFAAEDELMAEKKAKFEVKMREMIQILEDPEELAKPENRGLQDVVETMAYARIFITCKKLLDLLVTGFEGFSGVSVPNHVIERMNRPEEWCANVVTFVPYICNIMEGEMDGPLNKAFHTAMNARYPDFFKYEAGILTSGELTYFKEVAGSHTS